LVADESGACSPAIVVMTQSAAEGREGHGGDEVHVAWYERAACARRRFTAEIAVAFVVLSMIEAYK
jgi:hypothetical protein